MPTVVLTLFAGQGTGGTDERTDVPTLHIVSYFAGTDAFMSLHKPIITLFLTPKKTFYEFTNSFHAKYKPINSKCWLGRTEEWTKRRLYASPFGERKKMSKTCLKLLKNVKTIILQGHFSARNMI